MNGDAAIEAPGRAADRFRLLAEAMPQLVWIAGDDGVVSYYNARVNRYGATRTADGGFDWHSLVHPEDVPATLEAWAGAVRERRPYECEHRLRMADGGYRWHLSRATPAEGRWFGTATDVDDMKRAHAEAQRAWLALEESEARFRQTADHLPLMVWVHDAEGEQAWVNQTFCEFFRVSRDEMRRSRWQALLHPEDGALYTRAFLASVRGRRDFHAETRVMHADGTWHWIESWGRARFDRDGRFLGHIGTSADVTVRKAAEAEQRDASRRKDEFLATLAHELRNPLAPLRTGLAVLSLAGDRPELAAQTRAMMERQVAQLVRLIDDLLDVSRISRGKVELRVARMDLGEAVRAAVETARPALEGRRLEVDEAGVPLPLDGDAVRIAQVVANLLHNAAKFTVVGGHVRLRTRRDGDHAVVTVQDDGAGIPPDRLEEVFDMFRQLDTPGGAAGLGIGLALVRQFVAMHGGTVRARSAGPGCGSTFEVRLPLAAHG